MRDDLAAARAVLKKHSMMLLTASKAYVRHPELAAAKANRDYVLKQVNYILYFSKALGYCFLYESSLVSSYVIIYIC